ncbi:MAG: hypothetical protein JW759_04620 [Candidatus Coatesbacteria bacterium]|nr:hypothetical protein [Candidatus Coatesbacteria bacterium]
MRQPLKRVANEMSPFQGSDPLDVFLNNRSRAADAPTIEGLTKNSAARNSMRP